MSSESGQRLSMEELKRRNAPQPTPTQACPSKEEWQELLHRLDELERHTAAHTALLREASSRSELCPTQAQMEALARDVAEIRAILRQAGKRTEKRFSLPGIRLPRLRLPHLDGPTWAALLMGTAALLLLWWGLGTVWSNLSLMLQ